MCKNRILVFGLCAMLFMVCAAGVSAAINWNNFKVFSGTSPPYAANGPGCSGFNFGGGGVDIQVQTVQILIQYMI